MVSDDDEEFLEEDLIRFAIKQYYNPKGIDVDEFYDDLKRVKYIKRLLNRYLDHGRLTERLIMNHLIVIFNVFGYYGGIKILQVKLEDKHWPVLKPFLVYLKAIRNDQFTGIEMDQKVVERLREI
jgi:hypothetical protein